jgi:hypothetical protein
MTRNKLSIVAICALAICTLGSNAGCGGRQEDLEKPLSLDTPLALKGTLVFLDHDNDRAFLLDVTQKPLESAAQVVELPHDPVLLVRRNAADEALVLSLGQRASSTEDDEPAELAALRDDGTLRRYKLGNSFDKLSQSEDGRYALLFKSGESMRLIGNPNEIAIVDLSKSPKDKGAVSLRTLLSFGESPLSAVFSPQMEIVGEKRRLAIVLSQKNVTLIDLDHLDRRETTVQLSRQGDQAVVPVQIAFNPSAPELYVRGENSSDIFVFNLSPRPGSDVESGEAPVMDDGKAHNDFRPFIDQLGVGGRPTDITVYDDGAGPRLLVLTGAEQTAAIVEASTREIVSVSLPAFAQHALVFQAASPRDSKVATRALLYSEDSAALTFIDLVDVADSGNRNVEQLVLERNVAKLIPLDAEKRVLVLHDGGALSLVDLAGRTVSPISSDTPLLDASFDATHHALWVGPSDQPRVGWLELDTGDTHELLLDSSIETFVPMFESGRIAIVHPSAVGDVTVLDAVHPSRQSAQTVRGFLIAGLLDRGK